MKRIETRNEVKAIVDMNPDGISLTHLMNKFQRITTRLQLRTMLGALFTNSEISRERICIHNRRVTKYFPFNGTPPVKKKRNKVKERNRKMLSMKDFMPGRKYSPYIDF